MKDGISIIIPAFNEELNIKTAISIISNIARQVVNGYEIIVVNDGSTDKTRELVEEVQRADKRIKLVNLKNNQGMGNAFKKGISVARKKYISGFPADYDMSHTFFKTLFSMREKAPFISSYMTNMNERNFIRKSISLLYIKMMNLAFGLNLKYYNGYFICKRSLLSDITVKSVGFTFFAELKVRLIKAGTRFIEIPFTTSPRKFGRSKALRLKNILQTFYYTLVLFKDIYFK